MDILGGIGSLAGAALSYIGGQQTNATNAGIAAQQMMYQQYGQLEQERFSNEQRGAAQDFSADQANINRAWLGDQATIARDFNRDQAGIARDFDRDQAQIARDFNRDQRLEVQAWEENMANTAYQRSVADMKRAGLNPILGVSSGGAATPNIGQIGSPAPTAGAASTGSPSSGAPTSSGGSVGGLPGTSWRAVNALGEAISSGLSAYRTMADVDEIAQRVEQSKFATASLAAQADRSRAEADNIRADTAIKTDLTPALLRQQIINAGLEPGKADALIEQLGASAGASRAAAGASSSAAELDRARTSQQQMETGYFGRTGVKPGTGTEVTSTAGYLKNMLDNAVSGLRNYFNAAGAPKPGWSGRSPFSVTAPPILSPGTD